MSNESWFGWNFFDFSTENFTSWKIPLSLAHGAVDHPTWAIDPSVICQSWSLASIRSPLWVSTPHLLLEQAGKADLQIHSQFWDPVLPLRIASSIKFDSQTHHKHLTSNHHVLQTKRLRLGVLSDFLSHSADVVTEPRFSHPRASIAWILSSSFLTSTRSSKSWVIIPMTNTHGPERLFSWAKHLYVYLWLLNVPFLQAVLCAVNDHIYFLYDTIWTLYVGTNQLKSILSLCKELFPSLLRLLIAVILWKEQQNTLHSSTFFTSSESLRLTHTFWKVWCTVPYYTSWFPIFFDKHHKYYTFY